jgi:hypothetical protein
VTQVLADFQLQHGGPSEVWLVWSIVG